jgi:hypothetical protein
VERWVKWSCSPDELPAHLAPLFSPSFDVPWIRVRKKRLLRMIRLDRGGAHREEPDPRRRIDRGLGFELTRIEVSRPGETATHGNGAAGSASAPRGDPAQLAWTLGFEAFPADVDAGGEFAPLVRACLEDFPEPQLLVPGVSKGYPAWLAEGG